MQDILKIGLVVQDESGRLLVVRKKGGITFILPGGKPEPGESDEKCLARELGEELGIGLQGRPEYLVAIAAPAADLPGRTVLVRAYRGRLEGEPSAQAEIAEMRWIDPRMPDVPLAETIRDGILPMLR